MERRFRNREIRTSKNAAFDGCQARQLRTVQLFARYYSSRSQVNNEWKTSGTVRENDITGREMKIRNE